MLFLGILLGLFTEVIQQFIPGSGMDIYDGITDTLGIVVRYYCCQMYHPKIDELIVKSGA